MLRPLIFLLFNLLAIDVAPSGGGSSLWLLLCLPLLALLYFQRRFVRKGWLVFLELSISTLFFFYGAELSPNALNVSLYMLFYLTALSLALHPQVAWFLLPFLLPFILYMALFRWVALPLNSWIALPLLLLLFIGVLFLLPIFFQWVWRCEPLGESPLKERIDSLCKKHHFRHGGVLIWRVLSHASTAAIIGLIPRFRYILFTRPLIEGFPEEEVEAVLAHEVGHAKHHHLLLYPFLFLGLPLLISLVASTLKGVSPLIELALYGLLIFVYIRFLIGYFSRQFERQADLHVFAFDLPPGTLVSALQRTADRNFLSLKKRNWHHGSFAKRIEFLKQAEIAPGLIARHHKKVKGIVAAYFLITLSIWYVGYFYS